MLRLIIIIFFLYTYTTVTTCNNQKRDWVYYDFPTQCNKTVQYTFLQGDSFYLEEGCSGLYPATIVASFVDSSNPIPLINGEVCDGGNIVHANIIEPEGKIRENMNDAPSHKLFYI